MVHQRCAYQTAISDLIVIANDCIIERADNRASMMNPAMINGLSMRGDRSRTDINAPVRAILYQMPGVAGVTRCPTPDCARLQIGDRRALIQIVCWSLPYRIVKRWLVREQMVMVNAIDMSGERETLRTTCDAVKQTWSVINLPGADDRVPTPMMMEWLIRRRRTDWSDLIDWMVRLWLCGAVRTAWLSNAATIVADRSSTDWMTPANWWLRTCVS